MRKVEDVGVMKDEEVKFEEIEDSHTLDGHGGTHNMSGTCCDNRYTCVQM